MASLVPCTTCQRHIRRAEAQCPFCGAQRTPAVGPSREVVIPREAKRATLLAIGLTLAGQACGGMSDANDPKLPGAGGSVGTSNGGTGGNGTGGTNAGGRGGTDFGFPAPPYGLMIPDPPNGGSAGSTGLPDSGPAQDAGADDAGSSDAAADDAGN